ncbi:MAG: nucleoside triphosphate pyrophosphohydrolase [Gammaproteobacteria bacterium]|nr:nucleoside triphosphate pyrophosphohydrolase [Gammaproteobacteria bacterium]
MQDLKNIQALLDIMARLRDPQSGCPWDQKQTYQTIVPYTLEEAYEVAEAIENNDYAELKDELGDLLFQVVFYAQIAKEEKRFDFADVVQAISEKMLRRHPHVFADVQVNSTDDIKQNWEQIKTAERVAKGKAEQVPSAMDGVTSALPALTRAKKLQTKAKRVGFDWPDVSGVFAKINEEIDEIHDALQQGDQQHIQDEVGDLLFAVVNLARHLGVDSDAALRGTNRRFEQRFRTMEQLARDAGEEFAQLPLDRQEALWINAKKKLQD